MEPLEQLAHCDRYQLAVSTRRFTCLLTRAEKMNVINRVKPEIDVEAEGGPEENE